MLKKIVKYGNSNALVLDKAILELLNIGEGSVVKLKTDGKSLIITPQEEATAQPVNAPYTSGEAQQEAITQELLKGYRKTGNALIDNKLVSLVKRQQELTALYIRKEQFAQAMKTELVHIEADKNLALLDQNEKGLLSVSRAKMAVVPELVAVERELDALVKEHNLLPSAQLSAEQTKQMTLDMMALQKKFMNMNALMQLQENQDYIHQSQLLAEKFQHDTNSAEFLAAKQKLIAQFLPDYEQYQKEMKQLAKKYQL